MNTLTHAPQTLCSDANALLAQINRIEAHQRPARLPQRLADARPGDVLVLVDCRGGVQRRLVTVEALEDDGALVAGGERYHAGNGFHLAGIEAGSLDRVIQPLDGWSWPGWSGSLALEL